MSLKEVINDYFQSSPVKSEACYRAILNNAFGDYYSKEVSLTDEPAFTKINRWTESSDQNDTNTFISSHVRHPVPEINQVNR